MGISLTLIISPKINQLNSIQELLKNLKIILLKQFTNVWILSALNSLILVVFPNVLKTKLFVNLILRMKTQLELIARIYALLNNY